MKKKIIPCIAYNRENTEEFLAQGVAYEAYGADELYISCDTKDYSCKEEFLKAAGELAKKVDIPIIISCHMERFEDVKKALYTGARAIAVKVRDLKVSGEPSGESQNTVEETTVMKALKEASTRFGKDRIYLEIKENEENSCLAAWAGEFVSAVIAERTEASSDSTDGKPLDSNLPVIIKNCKETGTEKEETGRQQDTQLFIKKKLLGDNIEGIITDYYKSQDLYAAKKALKAESIPVNTCESSIPFSAMKKNNDGLLPVVVQDYKTKEVLMVAYMNEEAYNMTVETGRMTYYSRSRSKLWIKGETSGHFQYVKSLTVDCDKDTLLAKVRQIGPACHTGSPTCFFEETYKKPYDDTNPLTVLDEVYSVIMDRKEHPKEGSYTNYLFDKGIDKILKKCGEEAAEIIIAAKNPDSSELKYEISDFLYHMMVLMAECGLDWKDIVKELAHRR
ncbi:bifunctional phosphoribosyl-AMP cyclohydrolase/phosphoribosyl-ATP diphosphatase HisIE [Anaerocolumna xylanovorans]|uniref:Histidine biosynthesis bifunctional protein HisIE n=1 Tax=Anaerocolumna xylanovorans DSM 12503 TaxID=1121345 RepID=A0A1M7YAW9_9FIRM|nr:bifunctional phosphoribosyl-AMP cyclohydrolase/phosphoribosyl-ATP diphosphatase HisIE [Anaerocolumna xylanovorans]SHO49765.1 phosphoribosyl-ATP pyrophosphatase /phosphoribosyl-AMP cyclohydrolase [Anaerocolumna xylanovorans DSM 12503]